MNVERAGTPARMPPVPHAGHRRKPALPHAPGAGAVRIGTASSFVHHGEILQGVFTDGDGRLRPGLVTLPCDLYSTRATFLPAPIPSLEVRPRSRLKARRAAEETLAALGWPSLGGYLDLVADVPTSRGFGSSTSDVLAAIRAVQDAFGDELPERVVAQLAVRAETASDALMFGDRVVLFAQRDGTVIEDFDAALPRLAVLGFGTSRDGTGVDTLAMRPAEYRSADRDWFRDLRAMMREALATHDPALLGTVATASTVINQRYLPMQAFDVVEPLIHRVGAVGLQTAHSGDIAGLLFDGADPDAGRQQELARRLLADRGITAVWRFTVGRHPDHL